MRNQKGDILITMIAVGATVVILFFFPMITLADRNEDVAQLTSQSETTALVNEVARTAELTKEQIENYILSMSAKGFVPEVEIEIKILDENPSKKKGQGTLTIDGNTYYTILTTQVFEQVNSVKNGNRIKLKPGDIISIKMKKTSESLFETLTKGKSPVVASAAATVTK